MDLFRELAPKIDGSERSLGIKNSQVKIAREEQSKPPACVPG